MTVDPTLRHSGWSEDDGPATTLLLLRHGQTALTPEKRFSGSGADPVLSEHGRWEAGAAARRLATLPGAHGPVQAVVSSPLLRARATAEVFASAADLPVHLDVRLREMDFGAWEGHTYAQVKHHWPTELVAWREDEQEAPPSGESFAAMTDRVLAARDAILDLHRGRTVLVVSHVGPIKALIRSALGAPADALFRMELGPASLSAIRYNASGTASLRVFNDSCHLSDPHHS
ncbi:histidine phosphatase family protein [Saccharothrix sp. ST-888]|uniref:histidine phosphatase family protein n=1 Tax=Saccharothrix sp. ST-888 TaxID=1427391 RepID=UPI0006991683|nr:histidine phosphatase family protein [Saccharothrix sp. ST-888]